MMDRSVPARSSRWSGTGTVRVIRSTKLHHHVAATPSDFDESVLGKDLADLTA
jgi:hypothetical protein